MEINECILPFVGFRWVERMILIFHVCGQVLASRLEQGCQRNIRYAISGSQKWNQTQSQMNSR